MLQHQAKLPAKGVSSPIWRQLSPKNRHQLVLLLAQLALKWVAAQSKTKSQEVKNGIAPQPSQNQG
jgi:hypothetical protein